MFSKPTNNEHAEDGRRRSDKNNHDNNNLNDDIMRVMVVNNMNNKSNQYVKGKRKEMSKYIKRGKKSTIRSLRRLGAGYGKRRELGSGARMREDVIREKRLKSTSRMFGGVWRSKIVKWRHGVEKK